MKTIMINDLEEAYDALIDILEADRKLGEDFDSAEEFGKLIVEGLSKLSNVEPAFSQRGLKLDDYIYYEVLLPGDAYAKIKEIAKKRNVSRASLIRGYLHTLIEKREAFCLKEKYGIRWFRKQIENVKWRVARTFIKSPLWHKFIALEDYGETFERMVDIIEDHGRDYIWVKKFMVGRKYRYLNIDDDVFWVDVNCINRSPADRIRKYCVPAHKRRRSRMKSKR